MRPMPFACSAHFLSRQAFSGRSFSRWAACGRFSYCVIRSFITALLISGVIVSPLSYAQESKEQAAQLKKLKQTIQQLQKELEATKSNRDEINKSLEKTEKNIGELTKKSKEIQSQLKERQEKLQQLRDERSQLDSKKREQESIVGDYMNAAYRLGQQSNMRLMLNQEDPSRVARNLKYYDYLMSARAEKITTYMATIERINTIEPEIAYQADKIQSNYAALKQQQQDLQAAQAQRKRTLSELASRIVSKDQQLRRSQEDRRQLQQLLSKVINNIDDINLSSDTKNINLLKGQLPWPAKGKVIHRFGSNRVSQKMRWEGILIASNSGDPVSAVHHGRVVFSDYLRGHGLLIILDHGAGYLSLYAHNQALYKELGEWVNRGDTIASVGNSGGQQNAALYFELRHNGKPTDPQNWLKRA